MKDVILNSANEAAKAIDLLRSDECISFLEDVQALLWDSFGAGGKVMIAGNGGSLCDAMHFAEELTGFFRKERRPLPALALSDPGHLSCVANDVGFAHVFSRMVESLGRKEDVLVVLSTSGNSENLILAAEAAKEKGISIVGFLGRGGGALKGWCDHAWVVDGFKYSDRIQEAHMAAIHILIELLERREAWESSTDQISVGV